MFVILFVTCVAVVIAVTTTAVYKIMTKTNGGDKDE